MSHQAKNENDVPTSVIFDKHPNTCPICNSKITPQQLGLYVHTQKMELQAPFRCVNKDCMAIFIGYYKRNQGTSNNYSLIDTKPKTFEGKDFSTIIIGISPEFKKIYNQAMEAENLELFDICGGGYRKALEFLIKDYLIRKVETNEDKEKIKAEFLGKSIDDRITNSNIRTVSKRAAWLGNDEAHYMRKWETKDLQDLKRFIDLTIHWIEAEYLTESALMDMPEK